MLSFHCSAWACFSCDEWRLLSSFGTQSSHCSGLSCQGPRAPEHRLSSCGTWAESSCDMWNLLRPRIKPMSPALAADSLPLSHHRSSHCIFSQLLLYTERHSVVWMHHSLFIPAPVEGLLGCFQFQAVIHWYRHLFAGFLFFVFFCLFVCRVLSEYGFSNKLDR